jgi:hypothetical protein
MLSSARLFLRSLPLFLPALDGRLLDFEPRRQLAGLRRFIVEFFYFGVNEARACLFVGLFFAAVFWVPRNGLLAAGHGSASVDSRPVRRDAVEMRRMGAYFFITVTGESVS